MNLSMMALDDAAARAAATYNAAADLYDDAALSFWERFGSGTAARLNLRPGESVLDVCCGSGASAIPAAARVAPGGSVLGVDLAEGLIRLGRLKAARRGVTNVEFRVGDFQQIDLPEEAFDAVVCVFGIFFIPDMARAVRRLMSLVRPGGRLAITTWGRDLFEPANTIFWTMVREQRPDLYKRFHPWDRINDPGSLAALLREGGAGPLKVVEERGLHPIERAEDWWTIVLGSGYRGTIELLDAASRERVRRGCLARLAAMKVRWIQTNVIYSVTVRGRESSKGA